MKEKWVGVYVTKNLKDSLNHWLSTINRIDKILHLPAGHLRALYIK